MRTIQFFTAAAVILAILLPSPAAAQGRKGRTALETTTFESVGIERISHKDRVGERRKPLLVLVSCEGPNPDQGRFQKSVIEVESFKMTARFYDVVQVSESTARRHPLIEGMQFHAPAAILFDSTRTRRTVAPGRASFRKVWGAMCTMARLDYKTPVEPTLQKARVLLSRFDQVDAAKSALSIKERRASDLRLKGDLGKARTLEKSIERDRTQIEHLYTKTDVLWDKLWAGVKMRA